MSSLAEAVAESPVVIDGGLATQLEAQGHDLSTTLWSARLLRDEPSAIVDAHRAFYDAGARVAITASYQASFEGLAAVGIDHDEAIRLMRLSVELADRARLSYSDGVQRWVAASVGPYGAARADGSEYTGDYGLSVAELRAWHRPRLDVLATAGADLLAIETIPSLAEVEAVLSEIDGSGIACWLSVTCDGERTRAGEPAAEAFRAARDVAEVIAVGANCTDARDIEAVLAAASNSSRKPVVAYPNSGEGWDAQARAWTGDPSFDPALVESWVDNGARLIGGCCRVGPAEIAQLATAEWASTPGSSSG